MTAVKVIPGDGRIARDATYLTWSADPEFDVLGLLADGNGDGFKALASAVLEADFEAAAFAVVDLERGAAFLFGATTLASAEFTLDGSSTSTWLEKTLIDCAGLALNVGRVEADPTTDLILGAVRGSGWVMGDFVHEDSAPAGGEEEAAQNEAEIASEDATNADSKMRPAPEPQGSAVEVLLPPGGGPEIAYDEFEVEEEPLAPVSEVEVEAGDVVMGDPMTENPPASADPFAGDLTITASSMQIETPTIVPESTMPTTPEALDVATTMDRPMRSPGKPKLRTAVAQEEDLIPSVKTRVVQVRFDDGQEVELDRGVYVGRNPTKNGVPVGYSSVTIRGEHVSRVHWELDLAGELPVIRDLGSMSGLILKADGLDPMDIVPDGEASLAGSVRVEFADRWADISIA